MFSLNISNLKLLNSDLFVLALKYLHTQLSVQKASKTGFYLPDEGLGNG